MKDHYRPHPKDGKGNVFTDICLLTGGVLYSSVTGPVQSSVLGVPSNSVTGSVQSPVHRMDPQVMPRGYPQDKGTP